jgi:copper(I)-binding protein
MKAVTRNVFATVLGLVCLVGASAAVASPAPCLPKVEKAWIRAAPPGATVLAGYALVRNDCGEPFALSGVAGRDFVMAMVHETRIANGRSTMRHARRTSIASHGRLQLAPGGHHLMLMHPRRALPPGTVVRLELLGADGRRVPADFTVSRDAPPK